MYLITSLFFLLFGGVMALLIRVQLWDPGSQVLSGLAYNEAVTAHGMVMVFWFLSPFAFGFANYVVPLQIGADDPRVPAVERALVLDVPLLRRTAGDQLLPGRHAERRVDDVRPAQRPNVYAECRVDGSGARTGDVYCGGDSLVSEFPDDHPPLPRGRDGTDGYADVYLEHPRNCLDDAVCVRILLGALLILGSDRVLGSVYFLATEGGALLWGHLWWFSVTRRCTSFFPALGAMLELFQTFSGRRLVGRKWVIIAICLIAVQSFLVWIHHMFLTTINLEIKTLAMATTIGISLPFDLVVFSR